MAQSANWRLPGYPLNRWLFGLMGLMKPESQMPASLDLAGLEGPAEIAWDTYHVPSIKAASLLDAIRVQGYVHGRMRGFQMDFLRRMPAGELAELLGPEVLPYDTFMRRLNLRRWAEAAVDNLNPDAQAVLQAYTDGVNQAWRNGDKAPEYRFLKAEPRPWMPVDTSLLTYFLSWELNGIWGYKWAYDRFHDDPVLYEWLFAAIAGSPSTTIIPDTGTPVPFGGLGIGSNNWVVSGDRTQDGKPLLANDPHLMAQLPSIWFQIAIEGGPLNVQGVSLPGAPGIIIGQNPSIAWGVTNVDPDCQDLYRIRMENDTHYRLDDSLETLSVRDEVLKVRGQADIHLMCEESHAGPVIHQEEDGSRIALDWVGLRPSTTINALLGINQAHDWDTFVAALSEWTIPAQNFVYADREGHIGYVLGGLVPDRRLDAGAGCLDGNSRQSLSPKTVPWEEMPRVFDPPNGYIVTANNAVMGQEKRRFRSRDSLGYRAARITELVEATARHTPDSFAAIQSDIYSAPLATLSQRLLQESGLPPAWREILSAFDGQAKDSSPAPTLLYLWAMAAVPDTVHEMLSQPFFFDVAPATPGSHPFPENFWGLMGERLLPLLLARYDRLDKARAFREAEAKGRATWGGEPSTWAWGRAHRTELFHPFIQVKTVRPVFGRQALPTSGDYYTPRQAAFPVDPDLAWPRTVSYLPSYRQILKPGHMRESQFMHLTGQSGHPLSAHYDDLVAPYLRGETFPFGQPVLITHIAVRS